ncbi:MAG: tetratricopeptide repeat protein [Magnetococcales bacterium]|nr:tetratricopeptide repeat protein [Magnetococcales bacterium]
MPPETLTLYQAHEQALDHLNAGHLSACETLCRAILESVPEHIPTLSMLASIAMQVTRHDQAAPLFRRILALEPNHPPSHLGLGLALESLEEPQEAITCFKRAIDLQPLFHEAQFALATLLLQLGQLDQAIITYQAAIQSRPENDAAHTNLGQALRMQGEPERAIEPLHEAQKLNPNDTTSLYLISLIENQRGEVETAKRSFQQLLAREQDTPCSTTPFESHLEEAVALQHFGRSGTLFLHSLFDSHPHITTTPGMALNNFFSPHIQQRFNLKPDHPQWRKKLAQTVTESYLFLLDPCSHPGPVHTDDHQRLGFDGMGEDRNRPLKVDRTLFVGHLQQLLNQCQEVEPRTLFKLIHMALDRTLGCEITPNKRIFHHSHNTQTTGFRRFLAQFPKARILTAMRHPVQSLESMLYNDMNTPAPNPPGGDWISAAYDEAATSLTAMWDHMLLPAHLLHPSVAVRLEDLKKHPREIMPKLAEWMGIADHEALYRSSFLGQTYWGPSSKLSPRIQGFDQSSVNRKVGALFSPNDAHIFETLFYPISVHYGYQAADENRFRQHLQEIRPLLDTPLDFETHWIKQVTQDQRRPESYPAYRVLHNSLKAVWKMLDKRHNWCGFPSWIKP